MKIHALIAGVILTGFSAIQSHAQIVAIQTANTGFDATTFSPNYGWTFSLGGPSIAVSELGYFDFQNNGLDNSHQIGIWDSSGTLLTQATIPSGTAAPAKGVFTRGSFRYTSVSPVVLATGQTYYIGAFSPGTTDRILHSANETFAPEITYGTAAYSMETDFARPSTLYNVNQGIFGPNFAFSAVPEPHEYAMVMGLGLVGFALVRNTLARRKAQAKA